MLSKPQQQYIQSLRLKKHRDEHQNFVIEGVKMGIEALQQPHLILEKILATPSFSNQYSLQSSKYKNIVQSITDDELKKISSLNTPNEILIIAKQLPQQPISIENLALYLDDLQDPGNMGTILRIADWFGIKTVLVSAACADIYNPKVVQATMGALFRVAVTKVHLSKIKADHPTLPIFGAAMQGSNIFNMSLPKAGILVIGNEGNGISAENLRLCDALVAVPSPHGGNAESLNAAVATGILCAAWKNYEL
jgi:RNA methyltransferase, TrmH family